MIATVHKLEGPFEKYNPADDSDNVVESNEERLDIYASDDDWLDQENSDNRDKNYKRIEKLDIELFDQEVQEQEKERTDTQIKKPSHKIEKLPEFPTKTPVKITGTKILEKKTLSELLKSKLSEDDDKEEGDDIQFLGSTNPTSSSDKLANLKNRRR